MVSSPWLTLVRRETPRDARPFPGIAGGEKRPSVHGTSQRSSWHPRAAGVTFRVAVSMRRRPRDEPAGDVTELAALADGSLAPERRAALEAQVAASPELADRLAEQERVVALTRSAAAAGETFHTALAPTELARGAVGEATLTKTSSGWRIELDATGLPRLDGGRFYEAWLRNAAGTLVPIGTFNEGSDVTLWAGVSPTEFTTLTITRERTDDDQASSGEKVLVGTVDLGD